jgi:hypothetical protein
MKMTGTESRAWSSHPLISFMWTSRVGLLQDGENVFLPQDHVIVVRDADFAGGILAEQEAVAGLHVEGQTLAVLVQRAVADGDDLPFLRFLLRRVRNDVCSS